MRVGLKKRAVANAALTALLFILLSKSPLVPSGIPYSLYETLIRSIGGNQAQEGVNINPNLPSSSVYDLLFREVSSPQEGNGAVIILIVLESLGLTEDINLNKQVLSMVEKAMRQALNFSGYSISKVSNDKSLGGTLGAELRYLCNLQTKEDFKSFKYSPANSIKSAKCLPRLIQEKGGQTIYIHNGTTKFYNRDKIMKKVGFGEVYFQGRLNLLELLTLCSSRPFCGSDENSYSTAKTVISHLTKNSNASSLINVLTIDSHGPYFGHYDAKESYKTEVAKATLMLEEFIVTTLRTRKDMKTSIIITSDHPPALGEEHLCPRNKCNTLQDHTNKLYNFVYMIAN